LPQLSSSSPSSPADDIPILLVDDHSANLLSLRAILEEPGVTFVDARSGDEAIQHAQSREFAVILLDLRMPGIDGFETARRIRSFKVSSHTPIVFLTANDVSREELVAAYELGAVDLLVKPLIPEVLRGKVRGLADLYQDKRSAREEAQQHRMLVEGTADYAIFMLDSQGCVVTWNLGAARLKGYQADEIIGQHFSRFYPSEAIERGWPEHELTVARSVGRFEDEGWRLRKDGTLFWANVVLTALRDTRGILRGFSKVTRDLTTRREAEEVLRRSEEHFRLLVESATDYAIFLLDENGNVASWNPGAERIKQYRPDEIIGQHFSRFYPQETIDRGWPEHELRVARQDGRFEDEGWRVRKDGSQFWANVVITALKDPFGHVRGFSKITRDMTERRALEEKARTLVEETTARRLAEENARAVAAERERLQVTLSSIGDAVISTDAEGRVDFLNPVAEGLTGWTLSDAKGRPLTEIFHIINETTRQPVDNPALRALSEGRIVGLANHTLLVARNGVEHPIDDSGAPIRDVDGRIIGSVLVFRDISSLRRANDALQSADRQKDEFLAMLAHELRNPLAPIRSGLELLRLQAAAPDDTLELMQAQVDHIVRLVDDLLDVSRIVQRKIELRLENLELGTIVRRSVDAVLPSFQKQEHDLRVALPAKPIWLRGDPVRLTQVLENLLHNASKYTPPHGRIEVSAEPVDSDVVITVKDNGIGIESDLLPRVFDLFTQSSRALDRSQGGLGIGLTLVKALVHLHGGTISVESPGQGRGSMFSVRLPTTTGEVKTPAAPRTIDKGRPLRILAVDDNIGAATLLSRLLTQFGRHEVALAHDGPEALHQAEQFRPEVILLDIGLPGMDGYTVARTLRQNAAFDNTLLVALTGYGQDEDRRKALEAGCDEHLIKPPSLRALQELFVHPKVNREKKESAEAEE
jgi:PAS domain S-box-containing protein